MMDTFQRLIPQSQPVVNVNQGSQVSVPYSPPNAISPQHSIRPLVPPRPEYMDEGSSDSVFSDLEEEEGEIPQDDDDIQDGYNQESVNLEKVTSSQQESTDDISRFHLLFERVAKKFTLPMSSSNL